MSRTDDRPRRSWVGGRAWIDLEDMLWHASGDRDRDRYAEHLAADAIHVLPGLGIVEVDRVLAGGDEAEPWQSFEIRDRRVIDIARDAAALVYQVRALRTGGTPYLAAVTSVYRRRNDEWAMVLHQQTPLEAP